MSKQVGHKKGYRIKENQRIKIFESRKAQNQKPFWLGSLDSDLLSAQNLGH